MPRRLKHYLYSDSKAFIMQAILLYLGFSMPSINQKLIGTVAILASLTFISACTNKGETKDIDKNVEVITADEQININTVNSGTERPVFNMLNKAMASDTDTDVSMIKIDGQEFVQINVKNSSFRSGSSKLSSTQLARFIPILNVLKQYSSTDVHIEGHTDSEGSKHHNQRLSEKRAKNIALYLIENGIAKERIKTFGYGEDRPISDNTTQKGKQENRRVTFLISKVDEKNIPE